MCVSFGGQSRRTVAPLLVGREAGIEDNVHNAICGHAPSTVGGAYGGVSNRGPGEDLWVLLGSLVERFQNSNHILPMELEHFAPRGQSREREVSRNR